MQQRNLWLGLLCLICTGCVTTAPAVAPTASWPLLTPAALGADQQVQQLLRVAVAGKELSLQCVVTVQAQQLKVVGLTPLGLRAFTLQYDGQQISEQRATMVPEFFKATQLINDIQLVYWPLAALQAVLAPADWQVTEPFHGTRRLRYQGRLVAEVHYADADPWAGRVWFINFTHGYSLYIESSAL